MVDGTVVTEMKGLTLPEPYRDGDLYLNVIRGGPGYGDPIERDPEAVRRDVESGEVLERFAASLYGVVLRAADDDPERRVVDIEATGERRRAIRKTRLERATPTKDWVGSQRERIERQAFGEAVKRMYAETMQNSPAFGDRYRSFWGLPADFEITDVSQVVKAY
jgi:acetone carboxylase alpha subunit